MIRRRDILRGAGGAAVAAGLVDRALAITPKGRTGTLRDIDHIVVFMQENRAFDHYFGMLNGVRGFGDPRPLPLSTGRTVWAQPSGQHADGFVLPFHGDSRVSRAFTVDGSNQSHQDNIGILNRGRWDGWGGTGELHKRMMHYGPGDLPFYYALADAFTICDAYHASTLTQTYPNRLHLFTGCNGGGTVGGDPQMHNYGEDETPSADMAQDKALNPDAYRWTTYAERLQAAGVSWKVYQEYDNFGDNLLSVFPAFRPCHPESELYRRGRAWVSESAEGPDRVRSDGEQLVEAFRRDVAANALPSVSWVVTAAALSEHPQAEPGRGEQVCAGMIAALVDNPEVFARTAFIVNYDEPGGFFDHMPPPVAPVGDYRGHSTVPLEGEAKHYAEAGPEITHLGRHPLGLGPRVPAMIVSPWSRGGFVCSQVFDHTSVIRLMEARFGVREPNISAWRRSVSGDLTSAFDFSQGASAHRPRLPGTSDVHARLARAAAGVAVAIPAVQGATRPLQGRRAHRPTPYALACNAQVSGRALRFDLTNTGRTGAAIAVHAPKAGEEPWHFTIGAGHSHAAVLPVTGDAYNLTLRGPNGLVQDYAGSLAEAVAEAMLTHLPDVQAVEVEFVNLGDRPLVFTGTMAEAYRGRAPGVVQVTVAPSSRLTRRWSVRPGDTWYDLSLTVDMSPSWRRRFAGKVETGRPTRTDPGIGAMRLIA